MKYNNILSLLLLTSYKFVNAYNDCAVGNCLVITVEDGISWGAEKNEWCISRFQIRIIKVKKIFF